MIPTAPKKPLRRFQPEPFPTDIGTHERQIADLACGQVAYLRAGDQAKPKLLLVHGIPTSARLWEPLLGLLAEHYDCIVPDLLGLGRSVPADAQTDLASPGQAAMLAQLLDHLGVASCNAVFHDQGGSHGQQMLKLYPDRIDAVVFTDCVCFDNWPVPIVDLMAGMGALVKPLAAIKLFQLSLRWTAWPLTVFRGRIPRAAMQDWEYALNTGGATLDHWLAYTRAQSAHWTLDALPTLEAWHKPTQVLWAAQDRFLPPSWGVELARLVPGADDNPILLPFAGHFWQMEIPATGARAIHTFFAGAGSSS